MQNTAMHPRLGALKVMTPPHHTIVLDFKEKRLWNKIAKNYQMKPTSFFRFLQTTRL
jgi:hypothetical protein